MRTILVSVAVCLAVLCHQAAAQTCPTKICNAAFTNPLNGGPEDCCKWDYNKGPCQMGMTPVTFRNVRKCADGSPVLMSSNSQGQGSDAECKCNVAKKPTFSALQVCSGGSKRVCMTMNPKENMDISGNDISCGGNSFCKVCGGLEAVKNGCAGNNKCVAFTFEISTGCGFLKTGPYTTKRMGWVAYTL